MPGAPLSLVNPPTQPPTDDPLPKYVNRNALLVFCAGVSQYQEWKEAHKNDHPKKDASKEFPGLNLVAMRDYVAPYRSNRPLHLSEVERYCWVLMNHRLFHYRQSTGVFAIPDEEQAKEKKGESVYNRLIATRIYGHQILPLLLSRENEDHWVTLLCLAIWARPKEKSLSDDQMTNLVGLSSSAVAGARRRLADGDVKLQLPGGGTYAIQLDLEIYSKGKGSDRKFCLPEDAWLHPGETGLDSMFEDMNKAPEPPVKKASPVKVVPAAPALSLSHLCSPEDLVLVQSLAGNQTPDEYLTDLVGGFLAVKLASIRQKQDRLKQKQERVTALEAELLKNRMEAAAAMEAAERAAERALAVQLQIDQFQDTDDD